MRQRFLTGLILFVVFLAGTLFGATISGVGRTRYLRTVLIQSCMQEKAIDDYHLRLSTCVTNINDVLFRASIRR